MKIKFTKMHGLGNDFVLLDCREYDLPQDFMLEELSKRLCHRRLGIGADQLILLCPSVIADFKMRIFNADGGEVEMCGNGIRCLAKYIWERGISNKDILNIETLAGIIRPERIGEFVRVDMGEPRFEPEYIPINLSQKDVIDYPLHIKDREFRITCVSMGNPHAVIFLNEDISDFPVSEYGPEIENHTLFPKRTNVEFVNVINRKELSMRVWERGSGETMACGTGASATGVAAILKGLTDRGVTIHLLGGDLFIEWAENNHVYMTGPAVEVFEGYIKDSYEYVEEKRRHKRLVYNASFEYSMLGRPLKTFKPGISVDISESGIGIVSDSNLEPGQVIILKENNKSEYKVAVVKWSMKIGDKYRAGLMFTNTKFDL